MKDVSAPNQEQETFSVRIPRANKVSEQPWEHVVAYVQDFHQRKLECDPVGTLNMVWKNEPFEEKFFSESAGAIDRATSRQIASVEGFDEGLAYWRGPVNGEAESVAFWLGTQAVVYGYRVVRPFHLPRLIGYQSVRSWVASDIRAQGIGRRLLGFAAQSGPLVSDWEGMTESAYRSWIRAPGYERAFYDTTRYLLLPEAQVPIEERFAATPEARRWLLVITPHGSP